MKKFIQMNQVSQLSLSLSYLFKTSVNMALSNFLPFVTLIPAPLQSSLYLCATCSPINLLKFVSQASCCIFSLHFLPSVCPVSIKFTKPSFVIMCRQNVSCDFLTFSSSFFVVLISLKTFSFLMCSLLVIHNICEQKKQSAKNCQ